MARLSLANTLQAVRPFFRRTTTKDSGISSSTHSSSKDTDHTAQTSTQPSPTLPGSKLRIGESFHESSDAAILSTETGRAEELGIPGEQLASASELHLDAAVCCSDASDRRPIDRPLELQRSSPPIGSAHVPHHAQHSDISEQHHHQQERQDQSDLISAKPGHIPISQLPHGLANSCSEVVVSESNADTIATVIHSNQDASSTAPEISARPPSIFDTVPNMAQSLLRKIWVKRPHASATLVQIRDDDLVDDVRDMILKKYANSLGRTFDSPDMTLRIVWRANTSTTHEERVLGPEEEICRTIDRYFPGGQTIEDALIIDVPQKRTPRPSPRPHYGHNHYLMDDYRPLENDTDYFPPMQVTAPATIALGPVPGREQHHSVASNEHAPRSISVLSTGQIPFVPSPGAQSRRPRDHKRPNIIRQHTSSPIIITHSSNVGPASTAASAVPQQIPHRQSIRPRSDSTTSQAHRPNLANGAPAAPPLPSPPAPVASPTNQNNSQPPTPSSGTNAIQQRPSRPRKPRKITPDKTNRTHTIAADGFGADHIMPNISSMLDNSVPPINVLIVEDNVINLKIMEGLMKRLKVRWSTAMNGQIAVDKWKQGGFHLVLMDIQMPVMNGLQATKEIRRLERVNGIGVFSSSAPGSPVEKGKALSNGASSKDEESEEVQKHDPENDMLTTAEGFFKSPVIIVALTASSLQSDRHEALAAGCNDFLTKPVLFHWLERKVKEWGCMQALIDFDGWRKWRDYAVKENVGKSEADKQKEREQEEKQRMKMEKMEKLALLQEKRRAKTEEEKKEKEKKAAAAALQQTSEEAGDDESVASVA